MSEWLNVADITPRVAYTATASQTVFTVPFVFFEDEDLFVYQNSTLRTLATHYTVTGAEDEDGGTVTLLTGATLGDVIMIVREVPIAQTTHIPPSGPLDVPAINIQISKLIAIDQQLANLFERSLHLPDGDSTTTAVLGSVAVRANRLIGFDTDGSIIYPLGPTFVGTTLNGAAVVDSRATAVITSFAVGTNIVRTAGYAAPGDGGGALYKRVAVQPTHLGKFQSADGTWWELSETVPNLLMFGADNTGVVSVTAALNAAYGYVDAGKATRVHAPRGVYSIKTQPNTIINPFTFFGDGVNSETTFTRDFNGTLNVGAFNVLCNGMQFSNFAFNAGAANVSGALIAFQSSASVGGSGFVLEDLDLSTNATDAIHTCLLIDGSNKTAGAAGNRDSRIRGVNVFGASDTSVLIKSAQGLTWEGGGIFGAGGTGTYTGGVRIEGTVGVPSNYVRVNVSTVQGVTTGVSFGNANDCEVSTTVISGNIVRDAANSLRCITRGRATGTVPVPLNGCAHFPQNHTTWTLGDPGKIDFPGSPYFMQFFSATGLGTVSTPVAFPTAFPTACVAVVPAAFGASLGTDNVAVVSFSATTANLRASTAGLGAIMIAIGY